MSTKWAIDTFSVFDLVKQSLIRNGSMPWLFVSSITKLFIDRFYKMFQENEMRFLIYGWYKISFMTSK